MLRALCKVLPLLQQHLFNLSDCQLEESCRYDLRLRYVLGLPLDDFGLDHSLFGRFRERLLKDTHYKQLLFRQIDLLKAKGYLRPDEAQRIDATHVVANVAVPSATELIRQCLQQVLVKTKRRANLVDQAFRAAEEETTLVAPPLPQALAPELREGKFAFDPETEILACLARMRLPAVPANSALLASRAGTAAP